MKLVDILARELKVWPVNASHAVQDNCGPFKNLIFLLEGPQENTSRNEFSDGWHPGESVSAVSDIKASELAEDHATAIVTREQWLAAGDALNKPVVDWSKAPEWAKKHGYAGPDRLPVWFDDFRYQYFRDGKQYSFGLPLSRTVDEISDVTERPAAPAWNGEGLPPIGVACEHQVVNCISWTKSTVLAYGEKKIFYRDSAGHEWSRPSGELKFRRILTAEQIAAEVKAKEMAEMLKLFEDAIPAGDWDTLAGIEALHDAGYRKQVSE